MAPRSLLSLLAGTAALARASSHVPPPDHHSSHVARDFNEPAFDADAGDLLRRLRSGPVLEKRAPANDTGVLRCFQVMQPPVVPQGGESCTEVLIRHDFANSYYTPAVLEYTPPAEKKCGKPEEWASVVLNLTVTSKGTQYDRLGLLFLNETELWRTSTAEPTRNGIIWTVEHDVSRYIPLFSKPGTLVFELDNIVNNVYTGIYNATLSATFYRATPHFPRPELPDLILPLSQRVPDKNDVFSTPPPGVTNVTLPINAAEAYVEIYASGNGNEEFWYTLTPNSTEAYFQPGLLLGDGPFREVQLFIDGKLAGAAFPYPVIFTGGIELAMWRPIAAYGAFEQPTYWIDITPFLPELSDGKVHNFTLNVAGEGGSQHLTLDNWYISGNVALKLDKSGKRTAGRMLHYEAQPFITPTVTNHATAGNKTVTADVRAQRRVSIKSEVVTGSGKKTIVDFEQEMSYDNLAVYTNEGYTEDTYQKSFGHITSRHNGQVVLSDSFSYPIHVYYDGSGNTSYPGSVDHRFERTLSGPPLAAGGVRYSIETHQFGKGTIYITNGSVTAASGTDTEEFKYEDAHGNTYWRDVSAVNTTVVYDRQGGSLHALPPMQQDGDSGESFQGAVARVPGPGKPKTFAVQAPSP